MRYFLLLILFLFHGIAFAQKQTMPLRFEHINTNHGLSNNLVNCIYKDADGYMWFGTEDGLNRYDGSNIKVYRHSVADSSSIVGNNIKEITADLYNVGRIWVSSHCWGLSNFNRHSGKSINFKENKSSNKQLFSNCDINVMHDDEGNTWVKSKSVLSLFNQKDGSFSTVYRVPNDSSIIYSFLIDKDIIWLGLNYYIKSFNRKTKEIVSYSFSSTNEKIIFQPILKTSSNQILFGSWERGICLFDPATTQRKFFLKGLIVGTAKECTVYGQKQLWVGTNNGLFVADITNGYSNLTEASFFNYQHENNSLTSLASNEIRSIYQDANGMVWLGTINGVDKFNPNYLKFHETMLASRNKSWLGFANETPKNILIEKENGQTVYWLNYWYGAGVLKVDENFNVVDRVSFKHPDPEWAKKNRGQIVSTLFRYGKDTLCIAGWDGIWLYNDKQKKLLRNYKIKSKDKNELTETKCFSAIKDANGNIWVGSNHGLHVLDIFSGGWKQCDMANAPLGIKYNRVNMMLIDKKQRLWLSDISYYSFKDKKFVHLPNEATANCFLEDSKGCIWMASELGLARFNEVTQTFKTYTVADGLKSEQLHDLVEDNEGNIWATSALGLVCYNTKTDAIKTFTTADGLLSNTMSDFLVKLPNGNLMYQHWAGDPLIKQPYIQFNPKELLEVVQQLPFHFSAINILGKERFFERSFDSLQQMDIDYKENLLTIHFKALEFGNNFNIRYRYRLNNAAWTELGNQENITFTNLRGGKYLLQVQATNAAGNWMDKTLQLKIIVHPPFWQTGWFIGLMMLLIAVISIYFVRKRVASIKAKALIQQQVAELEMKALKAQMNPHFVFNSLSSIQESIVHGKTEAAAKYLGKFSKLIRMVLMQSDTKTTALQNELDYLNLYLELESFRFENFSYKINTDAVSDVAFIRIPSMLIQPYLENAIKHGLSHKEGNKNLSVVFQDAAKNMLQVIIEDNGIGRKESGIINQNREASHVSMGMKITDERLQLLKERNAKVAIEDLQDLEGSPIGTRIILHIPIENN